MEAATLKKKKNISKGKLKKSIKNVICRPDPVFWPQISEDERKDLELDLSKYKIQVPEFKKPCWSELSQIAKKSRPKPPPIPKVDGLIFGIVECQKAVQIQQCTAILIEATVNPRSIVQPLIECCTEASLPVLCVKDLRKLTKLYFGIPSSSLGVKHNCLAELEHKILKLTKFHRPPKKGATDVNNEEIHTLNADVNKMDNIMDIDTKPSICPYLYRTDNKSRVFIPSIEGVAKVSTQFSGQDFIELSDISPKGKVDRKQYMKMIVKRISNNPNRAKVT